MHTEYEQIIASYEKIMANLELNDYESKESDESEEIDIKMNSIYGFCKSIDYLIQDLINNLIPRTLLLSNDQEVNLALTRFEAFIREFRNDIKMGLPFPEDCLPVVQLLDELADLYDVLQRKIPTKNGDIAYKFKIPEPFL